LVATHPVGLGGGDGDRVGVGVGSSSLTIVPIPARSGHQRALRRGGAFVARSLVTSRERAGLSFVSLQGTSIRLPTALAWRTGSSPPHRSWCATAEEALPAGQ
jgi:hypothetical protein